MKAQSNSKLLSPTSSSFQTVKRQMPHNFKCLNQLSLQLHQNLPSKYTNNQKHWQTSFFSPKVVTTEKYHLELSARDQKVAVQQNLIQKIKKKRQQLTESHTDRINRKSSQKDSHQQFMQKDHGIYKLEKNFSKKLSKGNDISTDMIRSYSFTSNSYLKYIPISTKQPDKFVYNPSQIQKNIEQINTELRQVKKKLQEKEKDIILLKGQLFLSSYKNVQISKLLSSRNQAHRKNSGDVLNITQTESDGILIQKLNNSNQPNKQPEKNCLFSSKKSQESVLVFSNDLQLPSKIKRINKHYRNISDLNKPSQNSFQEEVQQFIEPRNSMAQNYSQDCTQFRKKNSQFEAWMDKNETQYQSLKCQLQQSEKRNNNYLQQLFHLKDIIDKTKEKNYMLITQIKAINNEKKYLEEELQNIRNSNLTLINQLNEYKQNSINRSSYMFKPLPTIMSQSEASQQTELSDSQNLDIFVNGFKFVCELFNISPHQSRSKQLLMVKIIQFQNRVITLTEKMSILQEKMQIIQSQNISVKQENKSLICQLQSYNLQNLENGLRDDSNSQIKPIPMKISNKITHKRSIGKHIDENKEH